MLEPSKVSEVPIKQPDLELIERLEQLLGEAKSGEMRSIAYSTVNLEGRVGSGWVCRERAMSLLGALQWLSRDLLNWWDTPE